ncbi:hypothetical protein SKAU_G00043570 [Synaphobranchus kaupii]|uniref:Uncharacterized protein n=1 Tax=Synaphobranchus kaupii TaxID=118154 RepID=A0A9Q1G1M3_SYNKA|nr:hypothetical protein SKAU_G00043570 [Synaphobranchus kaupii]
MKRAYNDNVNEYGSEEKTKGSSEGNTNTATEDQASSSDAKEDTQAVIYTLEMEPCSSDSMDTVIIQPPDSAAHEQVAVPQLKRTDSILVLDFIREELESDSSEPQLSSHTGSDTEYKPTQTASSSSDEEDLKSQDKASSCEKLSSDEDQTASSSSDEDLKAESPTSTSVSVPQRRRKRGREVVEDGGSDPCEDGSSDIDDPSTSLAKRLPQKKRGKKNGAVKESDGGSDLFSPKNRPDQSDEDEGSDMEGESPTSTSVSVPQRGRKRGREVDDDGGSDPCEDGSSDIDDQSTRLAKRLPQKKRGKKNGAVKESEAPKVQLKRPWSEAERTAVNKWLGKFMAERRVPGKEDCVKCITQEKSLDQRSWKDVKNFVYNTIVTLNRRLASRKLLY